MKTELKIKGMMCPHCEARVKGVLEAIAGVDSADVSHKSGDASVLHSDAVTPDALIKAVRDAGYECEK